MTFHRWMQNLDFKKKKKIAAGLWYWQIIGALKIDNEK